MYEWARLQAGDPAVHLCLLPLKLLAAAALAERGCVSEALCYCGALEKAMRLDKERPPPCLGITAAQLLELRDRLAGHAAAHNLKVMQRLTGCSPWKVTVCLE